MAGQRLIDDGCGTTYESACRDRTAGGPPTRTVPWTYSDTSRAAPAWPRPTRLAATHIVGLSGLRNATMPPNAPQPPRGFLSLGEGERGTTDAAAPVIRVMIMSPLISRTTLAHPASGTAGSNAQFECSRAAVMRYRPRPAGRRQRRSLNHFDVARRPAEQLVAWRLLGVSRSFPRRVAGAPPCLR